MNKELKKPKLSNNSSDPLLANIIAEIRADIAAIEKDRSLREETNFNDRTNAIDDLEFHILGRLESLLQNGKPSEGIALLLQRAARLKEQLETVNEALFKWLRAGIKSGAYKGAAFREVVERHVAVYRGTSANAPGYDNLDVFIDGLFPVEAFPEETKEREPEMVFYQKTPARIIFELANKAGFKQGDVFYDIGSGLGHVCMLVNLLSGVMVIGVEFEPAYCNYATACAAGLNLPDIKFINADAREADYSDGTVFFMYTPFSGAILHDVLERLGLESLSRNIRILTYGPCTPEVAQQSWLRRELPGQDDSYKLSIFSSL